MQHRIRKGRSNTPLLIRINHPHSVGFNFFSRVPDCAPQTQLHHCPGFVVAPPQRLQNTDEMVMMITVLCAPNLACDRESQPKGGTPECPQRSLPGGTEWRECRPSWPARVRLLAEAVQRRRSASCRGSLRECPPLSVCQCAWAEVSKGVGGLQSAAM